MAFKPDGEEKRAANEAADVWKSSVGAGVGAALPRSTWSMLAAQQPAGAVTPLALPIRGLKRVNGRLVQPIQISISKAVAGATAITSVNGARVDRRLLAAGQTTFQVFTDPVSAPQDARIVVSVGDLLSSESIKSCPFAE